MILIVFFIFALMVAVLVGGLYHLHVLVKENRARPRDPEPDGRVAKPDNPFTRLLEWSAPGSQARRDAELARLRSSMFGPDNEIAMDRHNFNRLPKKRAIVADRTPPTVEEITRDWLNVMDEPYEPATVVREYKYIGDEGRGRVPGATGPTGPSNATGPQDPTGPALNGSHVAGIVPLTDPEASGTV